MRRWFHCIWFGLFCLFNLETAHAARQPYVVQRTPVNDGTVLRLYNPSIRRIIWSRKLASVHRFTTWSADYHALAIVVLDKPNNYINYTELLVWFVGRKPHLLPLDIYKHFDGILDIGWSPDKRRLLFRAYFSGGADDDSGQLLCYSLKRQRLYDGPNGIRRAKWMGNRTVRYRELLDIPDKKDSLLIQAVVSKRTSLWRCP